MLGFEAATVSDLVSSIKDLLEDQFQEVMVQGEVTNLSPSASGHWYFNLSDPDSSISCALFKMDAMRNPLVRTLKDGDKIAVLGPISVYQKRGTFQLIAKRLMPAGEGQLKLQYEKLKAKLSHEGLFDIEKKKEIPKFPKRIAVITAEHGAALQDFLNVLNRRSLWSDVVIIPALVQGDGAPKTLISALKKAQGLPDIDVVVLTRGGGSLEDLWAFNDENLVREIDRCPIPVISAVGHQVDFTLCDYVADFRAETPTAAAETLSQSHTELQGRLEFCRSHLKSDLFKLFQHVQLMTQKFHPRELLNHIWQKIQNAEKRLSQMRFHDRAFELLGLDESNQILDENILRLQHAMQLKASSSKEKLTRLNQVLGVLNPKNVLERGYTYVQVEGGEVLGSLEDFNKLPANKKIELHFHDGKGIAHKESV